MPVRGKGPVRIKDKAAHDAPDGPAAPDTSRPHCLAWMRVKPPGGDLDRRDSSGLMRREWRNVLLVWGLFLWGTTAVAARQDGGRDLRGSEGEVVRLTVELSWGVPRRVAPQDLGAVGATGGGSDPEFVLELSEG